MRLSTATFPRHAFSLALPTPSLAPPTPFPRFTKDDLQSMEFNAYLASSSSEEEEEVEGEEVEGEGDEGTRGDKKLKYKVELALCLYVE